MNERLDALLGALRDATPNTQGELTAGVWQRVDLLEGDDRRATALAPARWMALSLAIMVGATFGGAYTVRASEAHELAVFEAHANPLSALTDIPE